MYKSPLLIATPALKLDVQTLTTFSAGSPRARVALYKRSRAGVLVPTSEHEREVCGGTIAPSCSASSFQVSMLHSKAI